MLISATLRLDLKVSIDGSRLERGTRCEKPRGVAATPATHSTASELIFASTMMQEEARQ